MENPIWTFKIFKVSFEFAGWLDIARFFFFVIVKLFILFVLIRFLRDEFETSKVSKWIAYPFAIIIFFIYSFLMILTSLAGF